MKLLKISPVYSRNLSSSTTSNSSIYPGLYAGQKENNSYYVSLNFNFSPYASRSLSIQSAHLKIYLEDTLETCGKLSGSLYILPENTSSTPSISLAANSCQNGSYLDFDITALFLCPQTLSSEETTLILFPDLNGTGIFLFSGLESCNPPFLEISYEEFGCFPSSPGCCEAQSTNNLRRFIQLYDPNYDSTVDSSGGPVSLTGTGINPNYTTSGFSLKSINTANDTLVIEDAGVYNIQISLILQFTIPESATVGESITALFDVNNRSGNEINFLLIEQVVPVDGPGTFTQYQKSISFLYNAAANDEISISLFNLDLGITSNPDTISVGNLVLDAIRIGNSPS